MKPMLACDWDEKKVRFPVLVQPKIDGVRALNIVNSTLTGRSLRPHSNVYTTRFYSHGEFYGLDGEMTAAHECDPDLCRKTVSALNTITGQPFTLWWLFDDVSQHTRPYVYRYASLYDRVKSLQALGIPAAQHLRIVPCHEVRNMDELLLAEDQWLEQGYEGLIGRDPQGVVKFGRCTAREGLLWRIKRFIEEDAIVKRLIEGSMNLNEATVNALGRTERSSHAENMVPNGMIGSMECLEVKTGKPIIVSAGTMPHADRLHFFKNPHLILERRIKYKQFSKGRKDLPRFPTFQSFVATADLE